MIYPLMKKQPAHFAKDDIEVPKVVNGNEGKSLDDIIALDNAAREKSLTAVT